jgi:DNA-binding transcriptional LysR family regulator
VLTAAGERLRQEAASVLEQGARLGERTAAASRTVSLRLYAGPHLADGALRAALPGFHHAHPEIALKIFSEIAADAALEMLQRLELDLAVLTASDAFLPSGAEVLAEAPCVLAASRRLVGERELTPAEIGALPFVLPLEGSAGTRWIERALAERGVEPSNVVARTQYMDVQQRMVEAGAAVALLFSESFEASPVRPELRRLGPELGGLKRALVMRRDDHRPELEAVAGFIRAAIGGASFGLPSDSAGA